MPMTPTDTTKPITAAELRASLAVYRLRTDENSSAAGLSLAVSILCGYVERAAASLDAAETRAAGLVARLTAAQASLHGARAGGGDVGEGRE